MTFDALGLGALDYFPCQYGESRLIFRGPKRNLDRPFVAFLGGTETYGKFIDLPFPALVEDALGLPCVNFGQANAGIDVFAHDPFVVDAAREAEAVVVQVMGAQNLTNRFYSVHPRRNDRFLSCSTLLRSIYGEVDFADFHFTKHLLSRLHGLSAERFEVVQKELREAWVARMRLLLRRLGGNAILLWLSERRPEEPDRISGMQVGCDPLLVNREMLQQVSQYTSKLVEVVASPAAVKAGTEGMYYGDMEEMAAERMLSPLAHEEAADALIPVIQEQRFPQKKPA